MTTSITATIETPSGASITATLLPISDRMPADGRRIAIAQYGRRVGTARWIGQQITDIDARLGAADGSETEGAYRDLDRAICAALADASPEQLTPAETTEIERKALAASRG